VKHAASRIISAFFISPPPFGIPLSRRLSLIFATLAGGLAFHMFSFYTVNNLSQEKSGDCEASDFLSLSGGIDKRPPLQLLILNDYNGG
jgi:hypothetical protein